MLKQIGQKQTNFYSPLYDRINEKHFTKRINSAISLEFVKEMMAKRYSQTMGRTAKDPEMMLRILLLRSLLDTSDGGILAQIDYNIAYRWFIGINPDEKLPEVSLLTKFRTLRLYGNLLDDIITEVVRQCIERGIIRQENGEIIDTMHILANTQKKVPERIMKHLARKIFKEEKKTEYSIPDYKQNEDHSEAKAVMKEYLETVMAEADTENPFVAAAVKEARDVLDSPLFIEQKGIRSLTDKDARVGNKTRTEQFFGYKSEYMMTPDGIITAVNVENGAYFDGRNFSELLDRSKASGLHIHAVYGDKAYFRPDILKLLKEKDAVAYIPVSESTYRTDDERFGYNKDSDEWVCSQGNRTIRGKNRVYMQRGSKRTELRYRFEKEQCRNCPCRKECIRNPKAISKVFTVSTSIADYYEHSQWAKTTEFLERYKTRSRIESKNAEQKRYHGLNRAYGYGISSVTIQAKLTALATNLKQVVTILFPSAKARNKRQLCPN